MDRLKVRIFVEDLAQENILRALFVRICEEAGMQSDRLDIGVPYSRGGGSIKALDSYLQDYGEDEADCFVLGSDGNCKGFLAKRKMLEKHYFDKPAGHKLIFAIPDPHIERWYMLDDNALSRAVGCPVAGHPPRHKCDKGFYKNLLKDKIITSGIIPGQGGAEYGSDIARVVDIFKAGKQDRGFKSFCDEVNSWAIRNR